MEIRIRKIWCCRYRIIVLDSKLKLCSKYKKWKCGTLFLYWNRITVPNILNLFPWIVPADIIHRITRLWNICVHLWLLSDGLYHFNERALRFRTTARTWRIKNWGTTSMSIRRHFLLFCLFPSELYPARLSSYLPSTLTCPERFWPNSLCSIAPQKLKIICAK